jgi:hypothetical protein
MVSASGGGEDILVRILGVELRMEREVLLCGGGGLKSGVQDMRLKMVS